MAQTGVALAAIASALLTTQAWAAPSSPVLMATPPQPLWHELTIAQKIILAPLCDDWDAMEAYRQKTWLSIASRFPEMTPLEQRRVQAQMHTWSKLSTEEQVAVREIYRKTAQMPAAQRKQLRQQWEAYSSLSKEEKEKLKETAGKRTQSKAAPPVAPTTPAPTDATASVAPGSSGTLPAAPQTAATANSFDHAASNMGAADIAAP